MKLLVIPTTDWVGHPVPNRLNFIFDNIAKEHKVDVCYFKLFDDEKRKTRCNLIPMDKKVEKDISSYYIKNIFKHGNKITSLAENYDAVISANLIPGYFANFSPTTVIFDYLDYLPGSAAAYYSKPLDFMARSAARWVSRYNLKNADGIITPTKTSKRYLNDFVDCDIEVIPNGVDRSVIHASDPSIIEENYGLSHPVLGYVGSLENWVDLELIVELFPDVKKRYKNAKLLIIGPGLHTDYAERLRNKVRGMDISDSVIFLGRIPYTDLPRYISAMDVGLNPRKDLMMNKMAMGSKVLTYLACGVPVLSSNMPEIEERFSPIDGVFSYSTEEEFLAEIHKSICANVDPDVIKNYDWKIISKKYERTILDFIG
ncbi:MAG: glycosyltransferase [Candidatus Saliniplasma sp.]